MTFKFAEKTKKKRVFRSLKCRTMVHLFAKRRISQVIIFFSKNVTLILFECIAIMGRIVEREPSRYAKDSPYQSTKFNIQIQSVFKKSQDSAATTVRKTVPLIISAKDLECRCPRLKANRWDICSFYLLSCCSFSKDRKIGYV